MKIIFFTTLLLCNYLIAVSQVSGNRIYTDRNERIGNYQSKQRMDNNGIVVFRDSVLSINTSVLLNMKADHYLLVLGINQTAKNTRESLEQINNRIGKFISSLPATAGIKKQDVFVDFITQTKVYDYELTAANNVSTATQKEMGIQTKKNINIKFDKIESLDMILEKAAEYDIFDIIKVDYIVDDISAVHRQMLTAANDIVNEKKQGYLKFSAIELEPFYNVDMDNFYGIYPAGRYQTYKAFESGNASSNYNYTDNYKFIKKDVIMDKTSFYEGEDVAIYDKVINGGAPYIAVQFVLNYTVKYYIRKK